MVTLNISITEKQANTVNKLTKQLGFANRSEFFRALLRSMTGKLTLRERVRTYPFTTPMTKNKKQIVSAFKASGKYSPSFIKDLKEGMDNSDYFK
ncbi:hypothetical protein A3J78_01030 [Candidatus Beckwithbacteria bacterium RBG_13_35_6]|uniref:Ribbon-helix-helix protein CopG domain-containing protein n=1 Tax=Candidatus Beckwithbacteria bacterium RBG_13_35_6 TaxID=1797456 RepID=A0A1F5DDM2_9BACT|nr:MAG: hypothetical protein A3J78_01030 [Candidatus Beckwithbacteria bacterium RBG_13_35_6]